MTTITVIGTYFGVWPLWFPAFLWSCARNETIRWIFFTDCPIPRVGFENIRFERLTLGQLNEIAASRLDTRVRKGAYSQSDLRPAYGIVFADYLEGVDFWGHCDLDIVWGDLRKFIPEPILRDADIVACRKDFLAGHLTLWRNRAAANSLFRLVPAYGEILRQSAYFNFDEAILSTFLRAQTAAGTCPLRVHWPEQLVHWFQGNATPAGWSWRDGHVFDPGGREHIYLHLQEAKGRLRHIDFDIGDRPGRFAFTPSGIEARQGTLRAFAKAPRLTQGLGAGIARVGTSVFQAARVSRRAFALGNVAWARALTQAGIGPGEARIDPPIAIRLPRLGLRLEWAKRDLLAGYRAAVDLVERGGARFSNADDGDIQIEIDGLRAIVCSARELQLLRGLYVTGVYDWRFREPTVVLDLGLAAGLAALYFASRPGVTVVGYEPVRKVFQRAQRNLSLNDHLRCRVRLFNAGVGSLAMRTIAGFPVGAAASGKGDPQRDDRHMGPVFEFEEIDIADVATAVREVRQAYPDHQLVLNVAYERFEYWVDGLGERQLIERLRETEQLDTIHALFGRWTGRGAPNRIAEDGEALRQMGFDVSVTPSPDVDGLMLLAIRSGPAERPGNATAWNTEERAPTARVPR